MPLDELSSSEACLADYINRKTAEIDRGQGRSEAGVRPRMTSRRTPDADAVDLCVAQIHSANTCGDFLRVSRIIQIDTEVSAEQALVTAEVEMKVLSPFAVCSPIASSCTGTCWDLRSGQAKSAPGSRESLPVAHRLRIEKSFAFQKTERRLALQHAVLQPIELGVALRRPVKCAAESAPARIKIPDFVNLNRRAMLRCIRNGDVSHSVWRKHDDTNFLFSFSRSTSD